MRIKSQRRWHSGAVLSAAIAVIVVLLPSASAAAQQQQQCKLLCSPTLAIEPTAITSHLFSQPRVRAIGTGTVESLPSTTNLQIIVATSVKTLWPRVSLYGSIQWLPNATEARNPFTLYTASDLDTRKIRANAPTASGGLSLSLLEATDTRGWFSIDAHVGDLYSNAARPNDNGSYTHKLDLGLVGQWNAFAWLPKHTYVHGAALFALLDYVATGLPKAGDEVPKGERVFLDDVHTASLITGLSIPLTSP